MSHFFCTDKMTMVISWERSYHLFENHRRGIMFKGSRTEVNRVLENREKPSEYGSGSELEGNPDELRIELAGYWSHLLLRVKKQSEVADREQSCPEARS